MHIANQQLLPHLELIQRKRLMKKIHKVIKVILKEMKKH